MTFPRGQSCRYQRRHEHLSSCSRHNLYPPGIREYCTPMKKKEIVQDQGSWEILRNPPQNMCSDTIPPPASHGGTMCRSTATNSYVSTVGQRKIVGSVVVLLLNCVVSPCTTEQWSEFGAARFSGCFFVRLCSATPVIMIAVGLMRHNSHFDLSCLQIIVGHSPTHQTNALQQDISSAQYATPPTWSILNCPSLFNLLVRLTS